LYKNNKVDTWVITPNNAEDVRLLTELLQRLKIKVLLLTPEQKEELGLVLLLGEVDRSNKVDRAEVI